MNSVAATKKELENFENDLRALASKYNVKGAAFVGVIKSDLGEIRTMVIDAEECEMQIIAGLEITKRNILEDVPVASLRKKRTAKPVSKKPGGKR